jgi:hypothetical protein
MPWWPSFSSSLAQSTQSSPTPTLQARSSLRPNLPLNHTLNYKHKCKKQPSPLNNEPIHSITFSFEILIVPLFSLNHPQICIKETLKNAMNTIALKFSPKLRAKMSKVSPHNAHGPQSPRNPRRITKLLELNMSCLKGV